MRRAAACCSCSLIFFSASNPVWADFDPYQLNGGLVAAVAGRDYVVVATDTRLTDGGYEILSRCHASSRLWSPLATDQEPEHGYKSSRRRAVDPVPSSYNDGSVTVPTAGESYVVASRHAPVWIASSGCSTDCEQLKRVMRSHLRAATYFHPATLEEIPSPTDPTSTVGLSSVSSYGSATTTAPSVAALLSQVLYSRRGFPFYSFCVLAGLSDADGANDGGGPGANRSGVRFPDCARGSGHVCVYDAIGSYERVCVATAGTGRDILQPILDRQFDSALGDGAADIPTVARSGIEDRLSLAGRPSRGGSALGLQRQRAYPTHVTCSAQETVEILRRAYEAVSEREISVGDLLLVCVVRRRQGVVDSGDLYESKIITFPLKKH